MSTLQEFCEAIRLSPQYRQFVPMEASLSYPVPYKSASGALSMRFFVFAIDRVTGDKPAPIHRPIARLSVSYPSGEWMEYVRLDFAQSGWKDEVLAEYPPLKERGLTFIESKERRAHLYATIEGIVPSFGNGGAPSDELKVLGRECWELWQVVPEPGLSEEYRSLNATFFEWLEALGNGKDPGHA